MYSACVESTIAFKCFVSAEGQCENSIKRWYEYPGGTL